MTTGIQRLIAAFTGARTQEIEDALLTLLDRLNIDAVSGDNLDRLGAIVGQGREGFSDAKYRLFIKAKIGINTSEGDIEKINTVWKFLTGGSQVQVLEIFPATIFLYSDVAVPAEDVALVSALIQDVVAAGVSVDGFGTFPAVGTFGFGPTSGRFSTDGVTDGGAWYNPQA